MAVDISIESPSNLTIVITPKGAFDGFNHVARAGELVIYSREGETIRVSTSGGARFILLVGKPLEEPIAWYGPIVMNTWDEIRRAFEELERGTFIKQEPETRTIKGFLNPPAHLID
ncbi:pirin-like C-terminal cupin domain-containing protein [Vulcanisaeta thermophila]|uniref:pirin-like C-terminal cupin domain-containing protein n=1 Tax=Vulcanisaeta thermophila TaxID=867917 RepID=UPI0008531171|nr:pirin-like C-terminal cupin domain-containing protein [Vulcanisaeta thermophila]